MERTLSIIKPDGVSRGLIGDVIKHIEGCGLKIVAMKMLHLTQAQARGFYAVHRERPFFDGLVRFMTEGPIIVVALEADGAVKKWRDVTGATNPANAAEGTIRKRFGSSIERNAVHGSDSDENAAIELGFFFSSADLV